MFSALFECLLTKSHISVTTEDGSQVINKDKHMCHMTCYCQIGVAKPLPNMRESKYFTLEN